MKNPVGDKEDALRLLHILLSKKSTKKTAKLGSKHRILNEAVTVAVDLNNNQLEK